MVSYDDIYNIFTNILTDYSFKCTRNSIPSINGSGGVRLNSNVRETLTDFMNETGGENPIDYEKLWIVDEQGNITLTKDGSKDTVGLDSEEEDSLSDEKDMSLHEIHNHPLSGGYRDLLPEVLSVEDILNCVSHDWSKSVIATSPNGSKMILMKKTGFISDFETESSISRISSNLTDTYLQYITDWEAETRRVWNSDDGSISKSVLDNLPKGTKNAMSYVHQEYERIAQQNIGSFEERLSGIRSDFNDFGLDLSIEW